MLKNSRFLLWAVLIQIMSACSSKVDMQQSEVEKTLTEFGAQNPENKIVINTSYGKIEAELYDDTPLHRANFVRLIKAGHYDDRHIYRILKGVCVQGGTGENDRLSYQIPAEFRKKRINRKGALSMARFSENNPKKMSSASEFFIITAGFDAPNALPLNPKTTREIYQKYGGYSPYDNEYTVFGQVTSGLEIAEKIAKEPLRDGDKPIKTLNMSIELR
jgi:cyclophilin family peptidyl-prolyl cis-trans isomerase